MPFRRSASRCPLIIIALIAVLFCDRRHAHADELQLTLDYRAPLECPPAEAMQSAVRRLATPETKPYSARIVIEREQARFFARITSDDGTERLLEGNSCAEVAEASAVVLALAISPTSRAREAPTVKAVAEAIPPAASLAPGPQRTSRPVKFKLGAAGVFDLGTMPALDWAIAGRVGATARSWSASHEGAYWLRPERETLSQSPATGGEFSWWMLAVIGCVAVKDGTPRIELCLGPELGHLSGHGFGLPTAQDAASFRFGFQAMGELHLPVSAGVQLRGGLGMATVVVGRHAFYIDGTELHRPGLFAGRAQLGVDFIF